MRASPITSRRLATALGLALPLAGALVASPASADPRAWVDPPAKPAAAGTPEPAKSAAPAAAADRPARNAAATPPASPRSAASAEAHERTAKRGHRGARIRRLADTPAALTPAPVPAAPPAPPSAARVEAAQALATEYLSVVSSPGEAMVGAAPRFYGARVRFYGRPTTLAGLLAEKRGFVRRWPERRYAARAFSTRCSPDGAICTVRAIVDFRAANPERGAVSLGSSELVLEVAFSGERPVIVAESGRVLHRGGRGDQAGTLAQAAGRG